MGLWVVGGVRTWNMWKLAHCEPSCLNGQHQYHLKRGVAVELVVF